MKNAKTTQKLTKEISKKYSLCNFCFSRLTSKKNTKSIQKCYICKNIFQQINDISTRILESMSLYEFSNFETGIILKPSVIDRDDHIKSEFQIKGVNSIKASVNHEISKKLARKIKSEIKHKKFRYKSLQLISKMIHMKYTQGHYPSMGDISKKLEC